jgi:hypothetical protein
LGQEQQEIINQTLFFRPPFATKVKGSLVLGPAQPPIQCVPRAVLKEVKQQGCEADPSRPSSAEVKNGAKLLFPHTFSWHDATIKSLRRPVQETGIHVLSFKFTVSEKGFHL